MKDPQRLEPDPDLPEATYMSPDAQGGYVSYEDYQALRNVSDDLLAALEVMLAQADDFNSGKPKMFLTVTARAAIAAANGGA